MYYFSILATDLLLHLTQAAKLVVAYLALHNWTRNIPDNHYFCLDLVRMELQSYTNSMMIAVRATLVWKNCRC